MNETREHLHLVIEICVVDKFLALLCKSHLCLQHVQMQQYLLKDIQNIYIQICYSLLNPILLGFIWRMTRTELKKKTSKTLSTSHITIHLKYKNKKAKRNYCFPASVSIQTLMARQIKNGFVIFAARKVWGFKIKAIRYLQPKNGSKCVREILNSPLLLSCLQLLQWHIFITPNNK